MLYGLLASFFWGSSYALYTYPISWWGPLGFSLVIETTAMLFGLVLVIRDGLLKKLLNYISAKHILKYLQLGFLLVADSLLAHHGLFHAEYVRTTL